MHRRASSWAAQLYKAAALIATEVFTVNCAGDDWPKEKNPMVRMIVVVASSLAVLIGSAAAQEKQVTDDQYAELQKNFAEAYNRKDADAMAAAFAEDGIRVTPSGIFRGRDAIHRNLQDVLNMGLHDYTVPRMYLVQWARACLTLESGGPS